MAGFSQRDETRPSLSSRRRTVNRSAGKFCHIHDLEAVVVPPEEGLQHERGGEGEIRTDSESYLCRILHKLGTAVKGVRDTIYLIRPANRAEFETSLVPLLPRFGGGSSSIGEHVGE